VRSRTTNSFPPQDDLFLVAELATGWGISEQLIYRTIAKSEQPTDG
jgi:hypothetical protein